MDTPLVLFSTQKTSHKQFIAIATLNRPKSLNAQNTALILELRSQLEAWAQDDSIAMVWLDGAGDKSFCAGGDIRELRQGVVDAADAAAAHQHVRTFFAAEYYLCEYLSRYPKPVVCWATGIVMGGGMGLASAASHTIVTETTVMAMPEISIGLYPDAGGTWFLQQFPFGSGKFLGMTGSRFNGSDALLGNLAAASRPADSRAATLQALVDADWNDEAERVVRRTLNGLDSAALPASQILAQQAAIQNVVSQASFQDALNVLASHAEQDPWLQQAHANTLAGCPTSMGLIWRLLHDLKHASLADCIEQELLVSQQCCTRPDFLEGVRALLIDKDKNPHWVKAVADVDRTWLDSFFVPSNYVSDWMTSTATDSITA
ncbi:enoyl-CoA hydratase/isomerase family protein [Vitreoscilla massiliensis]|uniref:3-hydroxyisobutyryl-CoA hydrolase n=1 Tax=Vitreoscilla massiliensis TaxID=1689272 RepID=A0ABY4E4U8_9NEIS|nr:enoyl-CoA hydratase/isomerase family protein [Vitreoscilla massiliensis]UOO90411.1 enoyl-CoA hydratase/isomerase family protein [Vitreoscilla massiliensis]